MPITLTKVEIAYLIAREGNFIERFGWNNVEPRVSEPDCERAAKRVLELLRAYSEAPEVSTMVHAK